MNGCQLPDDDRIAIRDLIETTETLVLINYGPGSARILIRFMVTVADDLVREMRCNCKSCSAIKIALAKGTWKVAELTQLALGTNHELTDRLFGIARDISNRLKGQA